MPLSEKILEYTRRHGLMGPGDRVGVAVSGGADSVALLRLLLELRGELGIVLSVAHFHHQIRGPEADSDAQFVADLTKSHNLELHAGSGDAPAHARESHVSLETAARELRYQFFARLLESGAVDRIATGHTLDDQAETVLMKSLRGAGTRGLAGIHPALRAGESGRDAAEGGRATHARIVRPLLCARRSEVEEYLRGLGQSWREDSTNRDRQHLRNRVRHELLPLLERDFNPEVARVLAETAEVARAEEEFWEREIERLLPGVCPEGASSLKLKPLLGQPLAVQRRLVRAALERTGASFDFRHGEEILRLAEKSRGTVELPGGWRVAREKGGLRVERPGGSKAGAEANEYEYPLRVPGEVRVGELGSVIRASVVAVGEGASGYNPDRLLDLRSLAGELVVRNWRAGDRFRPAHRKSPQKVKTLLAERRIVQSERRLWPVVASGERIVWMRGFAPAAECLAPEASRQAVLIEELTRAEKRQP